LQKTGAALTALLGVLRDRSLSDEDARTRAIDVAVTALIALRSRAELDHAMAEERVGDAFERLAESLSRVLRPRGVLLELGTPGAEEGARHWSDRFFYCCQDGIERSVAQVWKTAESPVLSQSLTMLRLALTPMFRPALRLVLADRGE